MALFELIVTCAGVILLAAGAAAGMILGRKAAFAGLLSGYGTPLALLLTLVLLQLGKDGAARSLWTRAVPLRNGTCVGGKKNPAGSQDGRKYGSACGGSAGSRRHTGSRGTGAVRQPDFAGGALCGPADQPSRRGGAAFGKRRRLLPPDTGSAWQAALPLRRALDGRAQYLSGHQLCIFGASL